MFQRVVGVHMISTKQPNSFIDDTIKLTAFNNNDDHFKNIKKKEIHSFVFSM